MINETKLESMQQRLKNALGSVRNKPMYGRTSDDGARCAIENVVLVLCGLLDGPSSCASEVEISGDLKKTISEIDAGIKKASKKLIGDYCATQHGLLTKIPFNMSIGYEKLLTSTDPQRMRDEYFCEPPQPTLSSEHMIGWLYLNADIFQLNKCEDLHKWHIYVKLGANEFIQSFKRGDLQGVVSMAYYHFNK